MSHLETGGASSSKAVDLSASRSRSKVVKIKGKARPKSKPTQEPESMAASAEDRAENKLKRFLKIPLELKLLIASYVPTKSIPNLRMMSMDWAVAGEGFMFRDGITVRPHLDDMKRLMNICNHVEIAKGVHEIVFFAGDVDRLQLEAAYEREAEQLLRLTGGRPGKIWKYIDAIYNPGRFGSYCGGRVLNLSLPRFPNLRSLKITSLECPVGGHNSFKALWEAMEDGFELLDDRSNFLDTKVSISRYSNILSAAFKAKSIQHITLDAFPIYTFTSDMRILEPMADQIKLGLLPAYDPKLLLPSRTLRDSLTHIHSLRIGIIGPGISEEDIEPEVGSKMANFIGCFHSLRSLDISYDEEDDEGDGCLLEFERVFFGLRFPHLKDLRLSAMDSLESQLGPFLFKHRATLRRLYLGEAGFDPEERTCKEIITDLRDHLQLEKFDMWEEDGRIYDDNWNPIPHKVLRNAKLLELYVIGKCPWPMAQENPGPHGWKRKFASDNMKLLELTEEELKDALGEDWETEGEDSDDDSQAEVDSDTSDEDSDDEMYDSNDSQFEYSYEFDDDQHGMFGIEHFIEGSTMPGEWVEDPGEGPGASADDWMDVDE